MKVSKHDIHNSFDRIQMAKIIKAEANISLLPNISIIIHIMNYKLHNKSLGIHTSSHSFKFESMKTQIPEIYRKNCLGILFNLYKT